MGDQGNPPIEYDPGAQSEQLIGVADRRRGHALEFHPGMNDLERSVGHELHLGTVAELHADRRAEAEGAPRDIVAAGGGVVRAGAHRGQDQRTHRDRFGRAHIHLIAADADDPEG